MWSQPVILTSLACWHPKSPSEAIPQKEIDIGVVASLLESRKTQLVGRKCKTSHSRNLEIGTLGTAPPCCSRTRHKFEATKYQSHHTWQMCLPNSLSETSSHLIMMSHASWVSHSKSPMMYPRCPESRYKKEVYPVAYHCHLICFQASLESHVHTISSPSSIQISIFRSSFQHFKKKSGA